MRIIGLDIHRAFAEAAAWDENELKRLGRVDMRRHLLEAFAKKLAKEDRCTRSDRQRIHSRCGDRTARQASRDREPQAVRIIAHAKIKTDTIDAKVLAQLYARGFLREVWMPDEPTQGLRRQVTRRNQIAAAIALEEHHPVDPAQPLDPLLPARGFVRGERTRMAFSSGLCRRTTTSNGI
jgi:transposase